jgi:hypothetical protein
MEDKVLEYGQAGFNLPHDVVQLPSNGLFYKNKKKSLKVGYLTASDENLLLGGGYKDFTLQLLRNKIYEHDIKPEELLEGDIEAILLFLRNTSFGPEIELNPIDPKTGQKFKVSVNLEKISILEGAKPNEDGYFSITLPKSNDKMTLKVLTYGDLLEINKIIDTYPENRVAPRATLRLAKEIISINGNAERTSIVEYVESMPIADSRYIRKYLSENTPKLDLKREVIAPSGEKTVVYTGFGVEFFRPFFGI